MKHYITVNTIGLAITLVVGLASCGSGGSHDTDGSDTAEGKSYRTQLENLGQSLFFATELSSPAGQSCASCHHPESAFTDRRAPFSPGATHDSSGIGHGAVGFRNAPTLLYSAFTPDFQFSEREGDYVGGQFLDGGALSLEDQVKSPLLGAREMNAGTAEALSTKLEHGAFADRFRALFGAEIFQNPTEVLVRSSQAIAAFEMTDRFAPFTSKYDAYLAYKVDLSPEERLGLKVFEDPTRGNCIACHPSRPSREGPPLFTDFTYDNIGLPKNTKSPFLTAPPSINPDGKAFIDNGLAATTGRSIDRGRFKVPTLRNVGITAPYFHNGVFDSLEDAVRFYSERDSGRFGAPEVSENVNHDELGNLGLSEGEIHALVAFLHTLTDGYPVN